MSEYFSASAQNCQNSYTRLDNLFHTFCRFLRGMSLHGFKVDSNKNYLFVYTYMIRSNENCLAFVRLCVCACPVCTELPAVFAYFCVLSGVEVLIFYLWGVEDDKLRVSAQCVVNAKSVVFPAEVVVTFSEVGAEAVEEGNTNPSSSSSNSSAAA